jgi:CheY-like chemotaxis protein/HPt (histidine-containing phosphotransfer) domain-containing protein
VGTTINIKVSFPIADDSKIKQEQNLLQVAQRHEKIRVLLTEDNEFNRFVAIKTLNRCNCVVTEAINGAEAVEKLKTQNFDVILMDLQMPVLDGIEATKIIRKDLKITTPIIALSANAFKNEIDHCIKSGMNDYVTKPFEEKQLLSAILKSIKQNDNDLVSAPVVIQPVMESTPEKLYNMGKLTELCGGDTDYMKKMVEIFIEQSLLSSKQIVEALAIKDLKTVYQVSHRIKPSIDSLGIVCLKTEVQEIENDARAGIYSEKLEELVKYTDSILKKIVVDLGKEEF